MLEGEYEKIIDQFYEKIALFLKNFKDSRKSPKHFNDLIKIIIESINHLFVWKSPIGKLYLIMLLFEQISLLKDYLVFFNANINLRQTSDDQTDYSNSRGGSEIVTPFDARYEHLMFPLSPVHNQGDIGEFPEPDKVPSTHRPMLPPLTLNLKKVTSTQKTVSSNMLHFNEKPTEFDRSGLPEVWSASSS